jgi:zinc transport system substrate-binding protein
MTLTNLRPLAVALVVMGLSGCSANPPSAGQSSQIPISVSIEPQKYFVEKIGGDNVAVNVMIAPGVDPHTYEPKPEQLKQLSKTQAYFTVGVSLEDAWKARLQSVNPKMLVVDTSKGVEKLPLEEHEHEHEHGSLDPHIWLSPKRVKLQAETIYQTLVQIDPQNQAKYQANLEGFIQEIKTLDQDIQENLKNVKSRKFIVFHPEWGYFAKDYGLEMVSIEVEGNEPSASELAALIKSAKAEKIKVIFAQPEFSTKSSETIAKEIDGQVMTISAFSPDWSNNLRQVSKKMSEVLNK